MMFLFSFKGRIGPLAYAAASFAILFSQYVAAFVAAKVVGVPLTPDWELLITPLRSAVVVARASNLVLLLALAYWLIASWALAALAFRRAADANIAEWIATFVIAPIVQIPAILILCALPSRARVPAATAETPVSATSGREFTLNPSDWAAAAQAVVAGMGLTLASVAAGALIFGAYGFGMFVVSPFVIGAMAGYLANRRVDIGPLRTALVIIVAAGFGGIALVVAALEGIVCIILASPLGGIVALVGGMLGREVALYSRRSGRQTFSSLALLPLVFAFENVVSATTAFDTRETILVDAPPAAVWNAIVHMAPLDAPRPLPFRLGLAYPLGGRIVGEGVGAVRLGEFSTGTAVERVTEWVPARKLAFVVVDDVPAMRELSPYRDVHTPHVVGYFTTTSTSFELLPQANGQTEIVELASHTLKLDPIFYWLPLARWVIHENNTRVLQHIRRQSERAAGTG
jgi:uncharacterized membrane protein YhaH (DUF805 family)